MRRDLLNDGETWSTAQRIFARDNGWYVSTRGGRLGPFPDRQMAVMELNRYIKKMAPGPRKR